MKLPLRTLALGMFLLFPLHSHAASIVLDDSGQLIGADDVLVEGVLYDVRFVEGSCIDLFGGCNDVGDYTFTTEGDALAASQALFDQVFDVNAAFDAEPELTFGCEQTDRCLVATAYGNATSNANVLFAGALNWADGLAADLAYINTLGGALITTTDTSSHAHTVYADWTPTPVPVPPAVWLFGSGLLGLVGAARRRCVHGTR